jgi:GNAT superfamily N-acetyltransferase
MTEIRPIREPESEAFLQLLCDVFKLDFNRAYDVFYTEPYFDLSRKWALFEGPNLISALQVVPLSFGWGEAIGIAGVCTRAEHRNEGYAGRLLERVLRESERNGIRSSLLFAQDSRLYHRLGFESIDRVIRAPLGIAAGSLPERVMLAPESVRQIYDRWSDGHPDRLRRDDLRWKYWNWHFRVCEPVANGYFIAESGTIREGLWRRGQESLPVQEGTEWLGLTVMADQLGLTFESARVELELLGRNVPGVPQMFMTDQF